MYTLEHTDCLSKARVAFFVAFLSLSSFNLSSFLPSCFLSQSSTCIASYSSSFSCFLFSSSCFPSTAGHIGWSVGGILCSFVLEIMRIAVCFQMLAYLRNFNLGASVFHARGPYMTRRLFKWSALVKDLTRSIPGKNQDPRNN